MAQSIDTLGFVKYLEEHGIARPEAEAHAEAVNRNLFPQLATKADLVELKHEITMRVLTIVGIIQGLAVAIIKLT